MFLLPWRLHQEVGPTCATMVLEIRLRCHIEVLEFHPLHQAHRGNSSESDLAWQRQNFYGVCSSLVEAKFRKGYILLLTGYDVAKRYHTLYMQETEFVQYCKTFHVGLLDFSLQTGMKLTYFLSKDE